LLRHVKAEQRQATLLGFTIFINRSRHRSIKKQILLTYKPSMFLCMLGCVESVAELPRHFTLVEYGRFNPNKNNSKQYPKSEVMRS
jgi:hypothetical protein